MLAVLNHRASAYTELHNARSKLMGMRQTRSGLFIKKRGNPFGCHNILSLLADIAAAKFHELRLMLSIDVFDTQLRSEKCAAKQKRIWLGSVKTAEQNLQRQPEPRRRTGKLDNVTAFLLTSLWLRSLQKPAP